MSTSRIGDLDLLSEQFTALKDKSESLVEKLFFDGVLAVIDCHPTIDAETLPIVKELREKNDELQKEIDMWVRQVEQMNQSVQYWISYAKDTEKNLARYEQTEKDGRLIELPCKIGTPVYVIRWHIGCAAMDDESYRFVNDFPTPFRIDMLSDFGKTVFLTKEEAKATLKKVKASL